MFGYAETWQDVGAQSLRRRDLEAMRLALSCLRGRTVLDRESDSDEWLEQCSDMRLSDALCALKCASQWGVAGELCEAVKWARKRSPRRLLRARLALLLRCLLRVDAGDYGPSGYVDVNDDDSPVWTWEDVWPANCDIRLQPLPIRPLWQDVRGGQR